MEPLVHRARGDLPITMNTSFPSPFDIPPLQGLQERYTAMHALDREKFRHSGGAKKEDLLFFPICGVPSWRMRLWSQDMGSMDNEVSKGSFFGGSPKTIEWWQRVFYTYHNHNLSLGFFVGKDQTLINALFLLFPSRIIAVWLDDPLAPAHMGLFPFVDEGALGRCGPEWFYYQWRMVREIFDRDFRWAWSWWRDRQSCQLTRVLSMRRVLERQFGVGWRVYGERRGLAIFHRL